MTRHSILAAALGVLSLAASAQATTTFHIKDEAATEERKEALQATMERLNVTDAQKADVEAILSEGADKRQAVLASYGIEEGQKPKLNRRQMRSMRDDLREVSEKTNDSLRKILTSEQMDEFEKIQDEQREAMRARFTSR